jgi:thiamine biosynthesis lipoprotein
MATSGSAEQHFESGGKRYGHIIDPRSGMPAEGVASVTVVARSAAVADGLATAFYVGGRELIERYCSTHEEVLVLMIEESEPDRPIVVGASNRCGVEIID